MRVDSFPRAVRDWLTDGGAQRLAGLSGNTIDRRVLDSGYLLLETDSQGCCHWVTPVRDAGDDPPVYLIDPDDFSCASRSVYADRFSAYAFAHEWDAMLWRDDDALFEFDHPLAAGALAALAHRLEVLPTTFGWAMNQGCDRVDRFGGPGDGTARVAVAISDGLAVWSAVSAPTSAELDDLARLVQHF